MAMAQWYYAQHGQRSGPVFEEDLKLSELPPPLPASALTGLPAELQADLEEINKLLLDGKNSSEFIEELCEKRIGVWEKAAMDGDSEGQYLLGLCYDLGNGVPLDIGEAVNW
jgi:TPR repeat protein